MQCLAARKLLIAFFPLFQVENTVIVVCHTLVLDIAFISGISNSKKDTKLKALQTDIIKITYGSVPI